MIGERGATDVMTVQPGSDGDRLTQPRRDALYGSPAFWDQATEQFAKGELSEERDRLFAQLLEAPGEAMIALMIYLKNVYEGQSVTDGDGDVTEFATWRGRSCLIDERFMIAREGERTTYRCSLWSDTGATLSTIVADDEGNWGILRERRDYNNGTGALEVVVYELKDEDEQDLVWKQFFRSSFQADAEERKRDSSIRSYADAAALARLNIERSGRNSSLPYLSLADS